MADGLRVDSVSLTYGAAEPAVDEVSLEVAPGSVVTVLGANGAGKTSLVRAICGHAAYYGAATSGSVTFDGMELSLQRPASAARAGLVHVPEGRQVFSGLSVGDNLLCGAYSRGLSKREAAADLERVLGIFPPLHAALDRPAAFLSGGQQQMLAVGRGLMSRPRLLICDELSLGLAPLTAAELATTLDEIRKEIGMAILLIEQNARLALSIADHAYALNVGAVVASGTAEEFADDARLESVYLGGSL